MLHKLHGHCLLALLVLLPQLVIAASEDRSVEIIEDAQDAVEARGQEGQWVPIPVANPTLGTGIQAVLMYLHPKKAEDIPNTTSGIAAMYTSTDSWFVGAFHDDYFVDDNYRLQAFGGYGEFNLDFYGIGDSAIESSIPYEFKGAILSARFLVRIPATEHWYAGLQYLYVDSDIQFGDPANPTLPPVRGQVKTAALGVPLNYDSRDDNYYPTRGQYAEVKFMDFSKQWGGDFEYEKLISFYNLYIPVQEKFVFAARTRVDNSNGDVPFFNLAYLDMRGFARGRYQDDHSLSVHGEARYKFLPRWGVIGFYEMGWINDNFSRITSGTRVTSYGAGLRWQVTKAKTLNLGLDFAFSTDEKAYYIRIGEKY